MRTNTNVKYKINDLKHSFKKKEIIKLNELFEYFKLNEPNIKKTTFNWRVYNLIQKGILSRVGRGEFSISNKSDFIPQIGEDLISYYSKIKSHFPYANVCVWDTSWLNKFMLHQTSVNYILLEVEKEVVDSVFYFLKETENNIFVEPTLDILNKYASNNKHSLIVKSLVSEAPIQETQSVYTVTIEKILVDVFCDKNLFFANQGSELENIFSEIFNNYTVNKNRLYRYASRRQKKENLENYIQDILNPGVKMYY
ncbi:MAG: DUF6577 family protein [bacterium]